MKPKNWLKTIKNTAVASIISAGLAMPSNASADLVCDIARATLPQDSAAIISVDDFCDSETPLKVEPLATLDDLKTSYHDGKIKVSAQNARPGVYAIPVKVTDKKGNSVETGVALKVGNSTRARTLPLEKLLEPSEIKEIDDSAFFQSNKTLICNEFEFNEHTIKQVPKSTRKGYPIKNPRKLVNDWYDYITNPVKTIKDEDGTTVRPNSLGKKPYHVCMPAGRFAWVPKDQPGARFDNSEDLEWSTIVNMFNLSDKEAKEVITDNYKLFYNLDFNKRLIDIDRDNGNVIDVTWEGGKKTDCYTHSNELKIPTRGPLGVVYKGRPGSNNPRKPDFKGERFRDGHLMINEWQPVIIPEKYFGRLTENGKPCKPGKDRVIIKEKDGKITITVTPEDGEEKPKDKSGSQPEVPQVPQVPDSKDEGNTIYDSKKPKETPEDILGGDKKYVRPAGLSISPFGGYLAHDGMKDSPVLGGVIRLDTPSGFTISAMAASDFGLLNNAKSSKTLEEITATGNFPGNHPANPTGQDIDWRGLTHIDQKSAHDFALLTRLFVGHNWNLGANQHLSLEGGPVVSYARTKNTSEGVEDQTQIKMGDSGYTAFADCEGFASYYNIDRLTCQEGAEVKDSSSDNFFNAGVGGAITYSPADWLVLGTEGGVLFDLGDSVNYYVGGSLGIRFNLYNNETPEDEE